MSDKLNIFQINSKIIRINKNIILKFNSGEIINKYNIIGMSYGDSNIHLLDGMNEYGLSGVLHAFNEGSSISTKDIKLDKIKVSGMELVTYILSQCQTIEEVINIAKHIIITNTVYMNKEIVSTMHYMFSDNKTSVILEATNNGKFTIYTNSIGVMTNSPKYNIHMNNISSFFKNNIELNSSKLVNIDNVEIEKMLCKNITINNYIYPGDYSSASRFIRLTVLKYLNNSGNGFTDKNIIAEGLKILSSVIVPRNNGILYYESVINNIVIGRNDYYTQYQIIYDLNKLLLYIKHENDINFKRFKLEKNS